MRHNTYVPSVQGFGGLQNRCCQLHIKPNCFPALWIASVVKFHSTQDVEEETSQLKARNYPVLIRGQEAKVTNWQHEPQLIFQLPLLSTCTD